tara:strand:- start:1825 stop:2562 length:738 start_codon:yes stop_codon:yes gene_type:complete
MPRVHQMRTDLAQWYHSNKSSVRLQGMISPDERTNFEINGTDLLLVDLNVFGLTNANNRDLLEKMKGIFMQNNTTGASVYDLGELMQANSLGTLNHALKAIETKADEQRQQAQAQEKEMAEAEIQAKAQEEQLARDHESMEKEKDRRNRLLEAEIKAAGYGAMQDLNENKVSDFQDVLKEVRATDQYKQTMSFNETKEDNKTEFNQQKMNLEQDKLNTQRSNKQIDLAIARENKTVHDSNKPKKK